MCYLGKHRRHPAISNPGCLGYPGRPRTRLLTGSSFHLISRGASPRSSRIGKERVRHSWNVPYHLALLLVGVGAWQAVDMQHRVRCDDSRWVCEVHDQRPFLGENTCDCGAAGAPCPTCNRTDPEDPADLPEMPPGFVIEPR